MDTPPGQDKESGARNAGFGAPYSDLLLATLADPSPAVTPQVTFDIRKTRTFQRGCIMHIAGGIRDSAVRAIVGAVLVSVSELADRSCKHRTDPQGATKLAVPQMPMLRDRRQGN